MTHKFQKIEKKEINFLVTDTHVPGRVRCIFGFDIRKTVRGSLKYKNKNTVKLYKIFWYTYIKNKFWYALPINNILIITKLPS